MKILGATFMDVGISPVLDGDYYQTVIALIRSCTNQCLCSIFIIDHNLNHDESLRVDNVLVELASAQWRGVSTKLLIGGSRNNQQIRSVTRLAKLRAEELGVRCRLALASKKNSSHAKLVIADNYILTGSHNWSKGMFGSETQDSVLLESPALAAAASVYFDKKWTKSTNNEFDVSL